MEGLLPAFLTVKCRRSVDIDRPQGAKLILLSVRHHLARQRRVVKA
jgi:hypothetical protein